ncbi:MAG: ABC transporter permease [Lachnospiraceae bacterium]|nr:ABC transporter permease [Lachnospiraceae bacterium]
MKRQIWMEYRKLWNKVSAVAVVFMCVTAILHVLVYLNLQYRSIDKNGKIMEGLASYRALKEASEDLEGVMDGEYLRKLKDSYDNSFEKEYLAEHRGFLGTAGMTKYDVPNYCVNYAYFGPYMTNGNDKVGLDYEFLESEESFYRAYKEAVKESLAEDGLYSEEQLVVLNEKADNMRTPFTTGYAQGLFNLMTWFNWDYSLVFFVLAFALAGLFSKDNTGGVTELTLSSKYGRGRNLNARWIAGNLFSASVYLIYLAVQILVNGAVGTLAGWNLSAQMLWCSCLYDMTLGEGLLIMFFGGLLGALVIGNVVMLFSVRLKNGKLAAVLAVIAVLLIRRTGSMEGLYGTIEVLSPMHFGKSSLIWMYRFVGNMAVPCFVVVSVVAVFYVAVLYTGVRLSYKKYHVN